MSQAAAFPAMYRKPRPSRERLLVSEVFESLQGEGPHAGTPSAFLRLSLCNLRCAWCDTRYTWDFSRYRYENEVTDLSLQVVVERLRSMAPRHLVITGGEPLLQREALENLLMELGTEYFVEVETNGTQHPGPTLSRLVRHWNVSPKLSSSQEPPHRRLKPAILGHFASLPGAWLKLVVSDESNLGEAQALVQSTEWPKERVIFMPEGKTRQELLTRANGVAHWASANGFRFSTRLHVLWWDGARGR